jgi:hypothetical protein
MVSHGMIQRKHVASLLAILYALPDAELKAAAGGSWSKLFEKPLPRVSVRDEKRNTAWRH